MGVRPVGLGVSLYHRLVGLGQLLILGFVLLSACTPARREVDTDLVRRIKFQGNGGLFATDNAYALRSTIGQRASPFGVDTWPLLYFVTPAPHVPSLQEPDAFRIEIWYAHHGWFDAKFLGWTSVRKKPRTKKAGGILDLIATVAPGPQALVRKLEVDGLDRTEAIFGQIVTRTGPVSVGAAFDLSAAHATRQELITTLLDHGRAYAKVDLEIQAYPEEKSVDIALHADPGPRTTFGPITVEGQEKVGENIIRDGLAFKTGQPYKHSRLRATQSRLFEYGTFSVVSVEPDLSDPAVTAVPVKVKVSEGKFRSLRAGAGLEFDGWLLRPTITAGFTHTNVFNQLIRLETEATGGYATSLQGTLGETLGSGVPIAKVRMRVAYPRIAGQKVTLEANGSFEQDIQSGQFTYQKPEANIMATWKVNEDFTIYAGPSLEQYKYLFLNGEDDAKRITNVLFGNQLEAPWLFRLFKARIGANLDWRDDPLNTTRGSLMSLELSQSIPALGGNYTFLGIQPDIRGFLPIRLGKAESFRTILAGRLWGKFLIPWNDSALPYSELAFLGGTSNLRGFRRDQVGPYDCLCTYSSAGVARQIYIPQGGSAMVAGSGEIRYKLIGTITAAAFTDVGLLARPHLAGAPAITAQDLRWGAGLGVRYNSLLGPIRVDFALRPVAEPEDFGPRSYIDCLDADKVPRPTDMIGGGPNFRRDGLRDRLPVAFNIYLAIGEAI